jgi:hypothetical protein
VPIIKSLRGVYRTDRSNHGWLSLLIPFNLFLPLPMTQQQLIGGRRLDPTESHRLKRLHAVAKRLDASIRKTAEVTDSCSDTLRKARQAAVNERRKVQGKGSRKVTSR